MSRNATIGDEKKAEQTFIKDYIDALDKLQKNMEEKGIASGIKAARVQRISRKLVKILP